MSELVSKIIFFFICSIFLPTHTLQESKCGRPLGSEYILQSDRIVAGYDVGYYRYPWYAALIQKKQVTCGGALIGPKTVLTAAHCYKEYLELANSSNLKLENVYTVRLGIYNICLSENSVTEYKVEKVQVHELYPSKKPYFDICLLTLDNSTDAYEPLCLPSRVITKRPREGTVPGMGTLKYQGAMPCTVHEARLLIYPDSTCTNMINNTGNNGNAIENAFCAGYMAGGIDTCQGDSGGPLQIVDENGRYVLFGIVSFGFHCAVPGYLGMYTDVSQYIQWIKQGTESDLNFISSLSNNSEENITTLDGSNGHKKKKKHLHYEHPHKVPMQIIVIRNNKPNHSAQNPRHNRRLKKHNKNSNANNASEIKLSRTGN